MARPNHLQQCSTTFFQTCSLFLSRILHQFSPDLDRFSLNVLNFFFGASFLNFIFVSDRFNVPQKYKILIAVRNGQNSITLEKKAKSWKVEITFEKLKSGSKSFISRSEAKS